MGTLAAALADRLGRPSGPHRGHARRILPNRFRPLLAVRRRPWLRHGLAALAGLGVALVVHDALAGAEAERARWGAESEVLVARADLPAGHVVSSDDVEVRAVPAGLVPTGAVTGAPVGRVVRHPVMAGEVLVVARLAPEGLTGIAALLPDGTRAVAVPADPATTPPLAVGDRVDVLVAPAPASLDGPPPTTAAERAIVIDVGEQSVIVAVPAAEAAEVAFAAGTGSVALALVAA